MKAVKFFIFAAWISALGVFMHGRGYFSPREPRPPGIQSGDYEYAVYFRDRKSGDISISKQGNHVNVRGGLSFHSFGGENNLDFRGLAILSGSGEADSFILNLSANGQEMTLKGISRRGGMNITLVSGAVKTSYFARGGVSLSNMVLPGLGPGISDGRLMMHNPVTGRSEPVSVNFEGEEAVNRIRLKKYSIKSRNLESTVWTCSGGSIIMASVPPGFKFVESSFKDRLFPEKSAPALLPDPVSELRISSRVPLDAGKRIKKAVFTIGGIDVSNYDIESPRQELRNGSLHVRPQPPPGESAGFPVKDEALMRWLRSEPLIDSEHPEIAAAAAGITAGAGCAWEAARRINSWLFENISKIYSPGIPSSVSVLDSMEGDCNEHTFLFVALARSAGIPAKTCVGLAFYEGNFYYHAWPMVYAGEWVEMDPTLGLETVGPTHIKLIEGGIGEQMRLAGLAGSLELELEEVVYDTGAKTH